MKCRKDKSRVCGAGWRNSIFNLDGVKKTKVEVVKYVSILGETRTGCFKDSGRRDLPNLLRKGYGSPRKCFTEAMKAGYKYAGLQYYGECWAGNSYGKYGARPDTECSTRCKKDGTRTCGGGWRNEIY
jgi:hypothetical protein